MRVLVTGGAGYIGSVTAQRLAQKHEVTVLDNFSTGHQETAARLRERHNVTVVEADLRDKPALAHSLTGKQFDAVVHFAANSQVGESVRDPAKYYRNNVGGTLNLADLSFGDLKVERFVFSSTAAVYGEPLAACPIKETDPKNPINPYGRTKRACEDVLSDIARARDGRVIALRYFNAAGASADREFGEEHSPETHLIPNALRATDASPMELFGTDFPTRDGTAERDYIHVEDLADAHIRSLEALEQKPPGFFEAFNVGTGRGSTVREVIAAIGKVLGREVPVRECPRRSGDPAILVADSSKLQNELDWKPKHNLQSIVQAAVEFAQKLARRS